MPRLKHNKNTMSQDDILAYDKLKELFTFGQSNITDYCSRKNIRVSKISNKIYRGTLLLKEVIEIAKEYNLVIKTIKNDEEKILNTTSPTLTFKDAILLLEPLGYEIIFE